MRSRTGCGWPATSSRAPTPCSYSTTAPRRKLVNLGFSARHDGISVWVLTQQITSITKPYRDNIAAIVLFYTPSSKTTKAIFEDYAGELTHEEVQGVYRQNPRGTSSPTWSSPCGTRTGSSITLPDVTGVYEIEIFGNPF